MKAKKGVTKRKEREINTSSDPSNFHDKRIRKIETHEKQSCIQLGKDDLSICVSPTDNDL